MAGIVFERFNSNPRMFFLRTTDGLVVGHFTEHSWDRELPFQVDFVGDTWEFASFAEAYAKILELEKRERQLLWQQGDPRGVK